MELDVWFVQLGAELDGGEGKGQAVESLAQDLLSLPPMWPDCDSNPPLMVCTRAARYNRERRMTRESWHS
jgi:hypothetical protein